MKLAFIWSFDKAPDIYNKWRDGLRAAIEVIGKDNEVDIYLGDNYKYFDDNYDSILLWTDSTDKIIKWVSDKSGTKGIILTTDPHDLDNLRNLDVVFCESTPVYEQVRRGGIHSVQAFGTDTKFYTPDKKIKKDIEYFYPATFSPWKQQSKLAYLKNMLWCVGTIQPDGVEEYNAVKDAGATIQVGYFDADDIKELYTRAKRVPIPAIHGSERTVLEAMSMNILPDVSHPANVRTRSYIEEYKKSGCDTPREFVVENYNAKQYALKIMKGLGWKQ